MPEQLLAAAIRWEALGPLLVAALAIMGSPGPATISVAAVGSAFGVRRALPYAGGVMLGTAIVLVAVATGITAALLALPAIRSVLLAVSAVYILWLAFRIATAPPLGAHDPAAAVPSIGGGTLLGVGNPKAWVGLAAVYASAELADAALADAAAKLAVLVPLIVAIDCTWLLAGASLAPLLRDPRRARTVNGAMAVTLVVATALALLA